jgi:hypothetical protein
MSRMADDMEGFGSAAKALIALEELGQWDQGRVTKVITT